MVSTHASNKRTAPALARIQESLQKLSDDWNQNLSAWYEARTLYVKMKKLEKAFLCNMWNNIVQRFHKNITALQAVELDLCNAVNLISSLRDYVASLRDDFDNFESDVSNCVPTLQIGHTEAQEKEKNKQMNPLNLTVRDQAKTSSKQQNSTRSSYRSS